jgi:multidrug efflux pump subunit AcrB
MAIAMGPSQRLVPLGAVATVVPARGFARINRINGLRTVTLQGDIDTEIANAGEIIADTQVRFLPDFANRFPDVAIAIKGQNRESADTGGSIVRGFLFGLVAVFIMLAFLFRSYVEPLIVIIAIPMALVGAIWGHVAMGLNLSMPSMMGFVSLAGVVVNNSILLVLFIKLGTAAGMSVAEAAHQASRQRFRAILLTTLTSVMGMLPLLSETSLQAQVLKPLVTSLTFGLAASAVFILFLVPALYKILDDFGLARVSAPATR